MASKKIYEDGWCSEPAKDDRTHEYRIVRTPPRGIRNLRVLSHSPLGRYTHHWKSRTTPCEGDNCKACAEGNVKRWYGWLFVEDRKSQEIYCFEYTKAAAPTVKRYHSRMRTLRGAHLEAWRKDKKANGRLEVVLRAPGDAEPAVQKAPCRKKFLSRLWETNIKIVHAEPRQDAPVEEVPTNGKPTDDLPELIIKRA